MNKYLLHINSLGVLENIRTSFREFRLNALIYSSVIALFVALTGCEKQPGFERLKEISGNYKITKATFFKAGSVSDSVSYSNFGSLTFTDCKRNGTQTCPGNYKIGAEAELAMKASYFIEDNANHLQLNLLSQIQSGWDLSGRYEILEETDETIVLKSIFHVYFDHKDMGLVILELIK